MRFKKKDTKARVVRYDELSEHKPRFRLAGIGLDWSNPAVESLTIQPSMGITPYDAVIINPKTWFENLAPQMLGGTMWQTNFGATTTFAQGRALQAIVDQFTKQVNQLCMNGGVVVVFADWTGSVSYSIDSDNVQRLNRAMGISGQYYHITSMTPFFGYPVTMYETRWQQINRDGSGTVVPIKRSAWNDYLAQELSWRVILKIPETYTPIATVPIRDGRSSGDVLAAIRVIDTGQIVVLPHPTLKEAQDCLIECIYDFLDGPYKPDWADTVEIPLIQSLQTEIAKYEEKIRETEKLISGLERFKSLLFETGGSLEDIVGTAFQVLGLNPRKPEVTGQEDWLINLSDGIIGVCEVTGTDGIISKRKADQLLGWKNQPRYSNKDCKAIMVVNPFRKENPEARFERPGDELLSRHAVQICQDHGMAILFTQTLFEVVCVKLSGDENAVSQLTEAILRTNGVVEL